MKLLFLLFMVTVLPLAGQNQDGAVEIAKAISAVEDAVGNFTNCVEKLAGIGLPAKQAVEACKEAAKIASKQARGLASEAAGAAKASRPIIGGWGYSRRGNWWGGW